MHIVYDIFETPKCDAFFGYANNNNIYPFESDNDDVVAFGFFADVTGIEGTYVAVARKNSSGVFNVETKKLSNGRIDLVSGLYKNNKLYVAMPEGDNVPYKITAFMFKNLDNYEWRQRFDFDCDINPIAMSLKSEKYLALAFTHSTSYIKCGDREVFLYGENDTALVVLNEKTGDVIDVKTTGLSGSNMRVRALRFVDGPDEDEFAVVDAAYASSTEYRLVSINASLVFCENGAYDNGACVCSKDYTGKKCNIKCPCSEHGSCYLNENNEFMCRCDAGYYGENCDERCSCSEHGSCYLNENNEFKCECDAGYYGENCDKKCSCSEHGSCYLNENKEVKCRCNAGYYGENCDETYFCGEHGKGYTDENNNPGCVCNKSYYGTTCANRIESTVIPVCDDDNSSGSFDSFDWLGFCNKHCSFSTSDKCNANAASSLKPFAFFF